MCIYVRHGNINVFTIIFLFILTRNSGGDSKYILELRSPLIGMDFLLGKNSDHKVLTIIPIHTCLHQIIHSIPLNVS